MPTTAPTPKPSAAGANAGDDAGFLQPLDALGRGRQRKPGRLRQRLERLAPVGLQGLQQPPGLVVELQHGFLQKASDAFHFLANRASGLNFGMGGQRPGV